MPYYYYMGTDNLLILALIAVFILGLVAQSGVNRTFSKYSKERASAGLPAAEVARRLLFQNGSDVQVHEVRGSLTDHFDPRNQTVGLSNTVYSSSSVAAEAMLSR